MRFVRIMATLTEQRGSPQDTGVNGGQARG